MTSEIAPGVAPPRGTRPANRRDLILAAAGRLFADTGYANVSMSDVADAVNVTPSALYRHFPGKSALLFDAVADGLQSFEALVVDASKGDFDEFLSHLIAAALDQPHLGVLWQRESRNLPEADRIALRGLVRSSMQRSALMVREHRHDLTPRHAELLTAANVALLTSIGFHRIHLARTRYQALLEEMSRSIMAVDPASVTPSHPTAHDRPANRSRRDQLLDVAIGLFAERGFQAVSIDDIGAVVGISGPSLYHHFDSKQQLLVEALERGNDMLTWRVGAALADVESSEPPLRRLTDAYVDMALDHSDVISILIREPGHIDSLDERRSRRIQRAFIDLWLELARTSEPAEPRAATRIRVHAAQMIANDLGRTHHLHTIPSFRSLAKELCWVVQQSPEVPGP